METLEGFRQTSNEDEDAFAARVGIAAYRCGNVHTESEKIGFFINGIQSAIRSILSRFRRDQPRLVLTFEHVGSFARDEELSIEPGEDLPEQRLHRQILVEHLVKRTPKAS